MILPTLLEMIHKLIVNSEGEAARSNSDFDRKKKKIRYCFYGTSPT